MGLTNKILTEKYLNIFKENAELADWPKKLRGGSIFLGEVTPDGESGLYLSTFSNTTFWMNKQGALHRRDGPAVIFGSRNRHGEEDWYINGKRHRLDGPAMIMYRLGKIDNEYYYINDEHLTKDQFDRKVKEIKGLQQAGEPYGVDLGDLEEGRKAAMLNGWKLKRGPLTFTGNVSADGQSGEYMHPVQKFIKWYTKDGVLHHSDGPAYLSKTGNKRWFVNGLEHRIGGPSSIYPRDKMEWYFINGVNVGKEAHDEIAAKIAREQEALKKAGEPYGVDLNDLEEGRKAAMLNGWKLKRGPLTFTGNVSTDGESGEYMHPVEKFIKWYTKDGVQHRSDGPAYLSRTGNMGWYVNGLLHRIDGPAIIVRYGTAAEYYWINGVQYSKEDFDKKIKEIKALQQAGEPYGVDLGDLEESKTVTWRPSLKGGHKFTGEISPDGESGKYVQGRSLRGHGKFFYYHWFNKQRQLHNNFGPAVIYPNGFKAWYVNGKPHRLDGPAIEWQGGAKEYYIYGVKYPKDVFDKKIKEIPALKQAGEPYGVDLNDLEENTDGWQWPKVWDKEKNYKFTGEVTPDGESGKYEWYAWAKYGNTTSKMVVWWNKKGQVHNDFGPAYINTPGINVWVVNGVRHRMDGPAVEGPIKDANEYYINGVKYSKEDYVKKVREMEALKKAGEPYGVDLNDLEESTKGWPKKILDGYKFTGEVTPDGESGKYIDKHKNVDWFNKKFEQHNNFGPAVIYPAHNNTVTKMWLINGVLHRLDGPAIEWQSGEKEWYVNGRLHRLDGPAKEIGWKRNEYYIDGIEYTKEKFDRKIKEIKTLKQAGEPYGVDLGDL